MERLTGDGTQLADMFNDRTQQLLVYLQLYELEELFDELGIEPKDLARIVRDYKRRGEIIKKVRFVNHG